MAAVTVITDPAAVSQRGGRVAAPGRGGRSAETWKRHIMGQLKSRDLSQHDKFQDLIRFYTQLLEKTSLAKGMLSCSVRCPSPGSSSISALLHQNNQLKKTTGELAYQVVELQQQIKIKECVLQQQHAR
uniref:autophagy-related protein 16-like n=1 Tax=Epinephelus lanceolatus TaxID=310571 RepID=UPI001447B57E|nr:autophagy-related protein 16-like [Epinephelus lanceolatus]